jgi:putative transposase
MTNHVHLLLTPETPYGLTYTMQDTGRTFVRYINSAYKRTGSLWEGRYKASLIDSEAYLLTCMRYIEMNPVRAGMVQHPGEYRWSSFAVNAQGKLDTMLTRHPLYLSLGKSRYEREYAYRELFRCDLDSGEVHQIREALNQKLVLGKGGVQRQDWADAESSSAPRGSRATENRGRVSAVLNLLVY